MVIPARTPYSPPNFGDAGITYPMRKGWVAMPSRKSEYARMLRLAVDEETAADEAQKRGDDMMLIDAHRSRAAYFKRQADLLRTDATD
jgi:hypothetical protein